MEFIVSVNPNPQNTFQLINFYKITGEFTKALKIVYDLKDKGYVFSSLDQLLWVIDYYEQKKDYNSAVLWYEEALKLNPQDINFYVRMAKNFWLAEQKNKAKDLANRILQVDPKQVENLNEILKFK
jgi:tetratricopeptide (TPR) repeat protein